MLPQPLAAGSTRGMGQGRTLPPPPHSSADLSCPWGQRTSPRAHSPQPRKRSPKAKERDMEVPARCCLGAVAGTLHPPSPPQQERVPPWGDQRGKWSAMG